MKITGVIAEYDPMHNGHIYHLEQTRAVSRADFIVAVMSGDFTQRGGASLAGKWERAEIAVLNGADLVIELPFVFACNRAEFFAKGAMDILSGVGCDSFSFGSEAGKTDVLVEIADMLRDEPESFKSALKNNLAEGSSYPKAVADAADEIFESAAGTLLSEPNNTLAIEYLKRRKDMTPYTVKRKGSYHAGEEKTDQKFISAEQIRKALGRGQSPESIAWAVPKETLKLLKDIQKSSGNNSGAKGETGADGGKAGSKIRDRERRYFDLARAAILRSSPAETEGVFGMAEGMGARMLKAVRSAKTLEDFIMQVKTKRFTYSSIRRAITQLIVGFSAPGKDRKEAEHRLSGWKPYARVLAMNSRGRELLHILKKEKRAQIPIYTNLSKETDITDDMHAEHNFVMKYDVIASDIYGILTEQDLYKSCDFVAKPKIRT